MPLRRVHSSKNRTARGNRQAAACKPNAMDVFVLMWSRNLMFLLKLPAVDVGRQLEAIVFTPGRRSKVLHKLHTKVCMIENGM
jgi:hypothetical protein